MRKLFTIQLFATTLLFPLLSFTQVTTPPSLRLLPAEEEEYHQIETIIKLIPLAEKVKKLQAICRYCNANASYTFRTVISTDIKLIGGGESYVPLCRECFNISTRN